MPPKPNPTVPSNRSLATEADLRQLINEARAFEKKYDTRLRLGGDLAEHIAAHELGLTLNSQPQGPDAFQGTTRYEIKSRHRGGSAKAKNKNAMSVPTHDDWDIYAVVEFDDEYQVIELWTAKRTDVASDLVHKKGKNAGKRKSTVQRNVLMKHALKHKVTIFGPKP